MPENEINEPYDHPKFQRLSNRERPVASLDEQALAVLYASFDVDDRQLAAQGVTEYRDTLLREDTL